MKIHFWHLFFSLVFLGGAIAALGVIEATYGTVPTSVPLADAIILVLATFRLTRLFAYDSITSFIREWFAGSNPRSFLGTLGTLVHCPWCLGLWFSLVASFAYFMTPYAWFFLFFLALGGVATFIQILANLVGWSAEHRKLSVKALERTS